MTQRIRTASRLFGALAGGLTASIALALVSAAPVLAEQLHGGAHGRTNALDLSGHALVPFHAADFIVVCVAALAVCIIIDVRHHRAARHESAIATTVVQEAAGASLPPTV